VEINTTDIHTPGKAPAVAKLSVAGGEQRLVLANHLTNAKNPARSDDHAGFL
jgi:hypothetical protein